jgi:cysteine desulfurase/selenocysteine lyase
MAVGIRDSLDVARIRADFPILERTVNGKPLVYLDSAATSQKPRQVLDAVDGYYRSFNANVHRGVHSLGNEATNVFEAGRTRVASFIDAPEQGVVFLRNTTEALNLVAASYARELLQPGDRIVLTKMEHHSNLVPWQLAAQRAGLTLEFIDLLDDGTLDMDQAAGLLQAPAKLLSVTHQSNVLGTINDIKALTQMAHQNGAVVCVDAAQSVPHMPVSVRELDCDFLAFSGHKMCGPMGTGVLWARPELLDAMPPFLSGGSMIGRVDLNTSTWAPVPHKFEAGTPDVASVAGLVAACDYLDGLGMEAVAAHEQLMTRQLIDVLESIDGVTVYGAGPARGGTVAFNYKDVHAHDVGTIVDKAGIAIRAGHHCCQPLMRHLGVDATARASVYLYTTPDEVSSLGNALQEVARVFG